MTSPTHAAAAAGLLAALHETTRCVKDAQRWSLDGALSGLRVLALLDQHGPARVSALAEWDHVDASTMSRAVGALADDGLVARTTETGDGRAHLIALTDAGRARLAGARRNAGDLLSRALSGWSAEDIEALTASLRRLVADVACCPAAATRHLTPTRIAIAAELPR